MISSSFIFHSSYSMTCFSTTSPAPNLYTGNITLAVTTSGPCDGLVLWHVCANLAVGGFTDDWGIRCRLLTFPFPTCCGIALLTRRFSPGCSILGGCIFIAVTLLDRRPDGGCLLSLIHSDSCFFSRPRFHKIVLVSGICLLTWRCSGCGKLRGWFCHWGHFATPSTWRGKCLELHLQWHGTHRGDLFSEATLPQIRHHCHHGRWGPETELCFWPCWLWPGSCHSESGWRAIFFGWRNFSWRVDVVERRWQLGQQPRPQYLCPGYTARCQTALTVGYCWT